MLKLTKKLIGHISVDSGQVIIVDPCYLGEWQDGEAHPEDGTTNHYARTCKITDDSEQHGGEMLVSGIGGFGVVSSTYIGDGRYPVYGYYDETGMPTKITIEFT